MKAILIDAPGASEVMRYGDAPDPIPAEGELLIRVAAAGVNRADLLQRAGAYPPPKDASPILGLEIAGEVVQGAGDFQRGDRVMGVVTGGGYADYAVIPSGMALRIPKPIATVDAAALPEAFLTAYLNMITLGGLRSGERILIHAGASGVGTAAIQVARIVGATILATAGSPEKCDLCRSLGAEITVNYKRESFLEAAQAVGGVDMILDFIGSPYWADNLAALRSGGRVLLIGFLGGSSGTLDLAPILTKSLTVRGTTLRRTPLSEKIALTRAFEAFAATHWARGELRPIIDSVFPLSEASAAHRRMMQHANLGKILLRTEQAE
ncbi:MAG TPA: NAD(P)H-quinone oxidoreductase [Aggregatilineales bacterium]|nr:NAD(P)H-quinone oxidoreductase [Anaerolineales bacterium]HRE47686.1 NAD(P)H-quinone oxidoreductase [Aggregatilineales bacterium]